jgi:hypothetical protein
MGAKFNPALLSTFTVGHNIYLPITPGCSYNIIIISAPENTTWGISAKLSVVQYTLCHFYWFMKLWRIKVWLKYEIQTDIYISGKGTWSTCGISTSFSPVLLCWKVEYCDEEKIKRRGNIVSNWCLLLAPVSVSAKLPWSFSPPSTHGALFSQRQSYPWRIMNKRIGQRQKQTKTHHRHWNVKHTVSAQHKSSWIAIKLLSLPQSVPLTTCILKCPPRRRDASARLPFNGVLFLLRLQLSLQSACHLSVSLRLHLER